MFNTRVYGEKIYYTYLRGKINLVKFNFVGGKGGHPGKGGPDVECLWFELHLTQIRYPPPPFLGSTVKQTEWSDYQTWFRCWQCKLFSRISQCTNTCRYDVFKNLTWENAKSGFQDIISTISYFHNIRKQFGSYYKFSCDILLIWGYKRRIPSHVQKTVYTDKSCAQLIYIIDLYLRVCIL